jgi:hypothetical protein
MFTARDFLESVPGETAFRGLPALLEADPDRLRGEFLAIAVNRHESWQLRNGALLILWSYQDPLKACNAPEVAEGLISAFEAEFPGEKLKRIRAEMRRKGFSYDMLALFQFALSFAFLAPERGGYCLEAIQETVRGSVLETAIAKNIQTYQHAEEPRSHSPPTGITN